MWEVFLSVQGNPKHPLRDRRIAWYFVTALAVVFAVNAVFVTLAIQTHSGVVIENSYKKGVNCNRTIEKATIQQALGWQTGLYCQVSGLNV